MNDEDIRKEYIVQMEIILNDDPNVSEKVWIESHAQVANSHGAF